MAVINNRQPHLPAPWLRWAIACGWQFLGISRMAAFDVLDGGTEAVPRVTGWATLPRLLLINSGCLALPVETLNHHG